MLQHFTRTLNHFYKDNPCLWENDFSWEGFSWIAHDDYTQSIISFRRIDNHGKELIALCNFNPVKREHYRIGAPVYGTYTEVFSTDAAEFGGGGITNGTFDTDAVPMHGFEQSMELTIPPLSVLYFKLVKEKKRPAPRKKTGTAAKKPAAPKKTV